MKPSYLFAVFAFVILIFGLVDFTNNKQFERENTARVLAVQEERTARGIAMAVMLNTYRNLDVHPDYAWAAETGFFDFDLEFNSEAIYFYGDR